MTHREPAQCLFFSFVKNIINVMKLMFIHNSYLLLYFPVIWVISILENLLHKGNVNVKNETEYGFNIFK